MSNINEVRDMLIKRITDLIPNSTPEDISKLALALSHLDTIGKNDFSKLYEKVLDMKPNFEEPKK